MKATAVVISQENIESSPLTTTHHTSCNGEKMTRIVLKALVATYVCGLFSYYMLQHDWAVLQALTFQVRK